MAPARLAGDRAPSAVTEPAKNTIPLFAADLALAFDDHAAAAEGYRKALRLEPSNLAAVSGLGIALLEWTQAVDDTREGLDEAYAIALVGRGFERGGSGLLDDHRKVRQLALSMDARRPRERKMRSVLVGVASLADPAPDAVESGRAALEDGIRSGVPLPVVAPGLLIFAARAGDEEAQGRLQPRVACDREFRRLTLAVARALRDSARERPELVAEAARVEALAVFKRKR